MEESLSEFLDTLREADDGETCFVVEGKRDAEALDRLHVQDVREVDTNLYLFSERLAEDYGKAAILTDLDKEGKKLYGKLRGYLARLGVRLNDAPRDALWQTGLRQVEGLSGYIARH